jgi:hypothetical protein
VSDNMSMLNLQYLSCLSFDMNLLKVLELDTVLTPICIVVWRVWFAALMPMFHAIASRSVLITFFLCNGVWGIFTLDSSAA